MSEILPKSEPLWCWHFVRQVDSLKCVLDLTIDERGEGQPFLEVFSHAETNDGEQVLLVVVEVFLKTLLAVAKGGARSVRGKVEAKGNLEVLSLSTIRSELDRAESKLNAASDTE